MWVEFNILQEMLSVSICVLMFDPLFKICWILLCFNCPVWIFNPFGTLHHRFIELYRQQHKASDFEWIMAYHRRLSRTGAAAWTLHDPFLRFNTILYLLIEKWVEKSIASYRTIWHWQDRTGQPHISNSADHMPPPRVPIRSMGKRELDRHQTMMGSKWIDFKQTA